jgi:hypothetical protein
MSYGNLNPGVIFVRCLDGTTGAPVEGAGAVLTWVEADASFGGRLPLYDTAGKPTDAPTVDSTASGVAVLKFLWDPIHIGYFVSEAPRIRLAVVGPALRFGGIFSSRKLNRAYLSTRTGNERLYKCVNFGQAWSGGKGAFQFNSTASDAMSAGSMVKQIIEWSWDWEDAWIKARSGGKLPPFLPKMGIMRPSIEMAALVGGFDVRMQQQ